MRRMSNFVQAATVLILLLLVCASIIARCPAVRRCPASTCDRVRQTCLRDLRPETVDGEAHPLIRRRRALSSAVQEPSEYFILRAGYSRHSSSLAQAEVAIGR